MQTAGAAEPGRPQVTSAKAVRRDIVGYALFPGKVDLPADAEAVVFPPYQTPVSKVDAHIGERVERGQTLIELQIPDAKAAYAQAQANLRSALTAFTSAQAQYDQPVRDAKRQLENARAAEVQARNEAQSGDATTLEQATQQRQAAEDALLEAQAELKQNLLTYQQQVDAARMTLADAKSGFRQSLVKAPISGTIVDLHAVAGENVGDDARQVIARIIDYSAMTVKATIDPNHRDLVHAGTAIVFATVDHSQSPISGEVRSVREIPGSDGKTVVEATIDFKNSDGKVLPETPLRWVGVKTGEAKGVIAVPVAAIQQDSTGKPIVMVLEGSNWQPRVVETGLSDGDMIEVKSGVQEGDTVQVVRRSS